MNHQCPAAGCWRDISQDKILCRKHWHMVPKRAQRAVRAAWGDGLGAGTLAHEAAKRAAIEAVNQKLTAAGE